MSQTNDHFNMNISFYHACVGFMYCFILVCQSSIIIYRSSQNHLVFNSESRNRILFLKNYQENKNKSKKLKYWHT